MNEVMREDIPVERVAVYAGKCMLSRFVGARPEK